MRFCAHHKRYTINPSDVQPWSYQYSDGKIEYIQMVFENNSPETGILVKYRTGEICRWKSKHLGVYTDQFGIAVSYDGQKIFAQTWENGLFCLDAKSGKTIWHTESRRGITNIFVNDDTIAAQQHGHALQLIDIDTGKVIKEKRPSTARSFTSLNDKYIICRVTARKWGIIESETLNTKESFTHKEFTDNHIDFSINHIVLCENGIIHIKGFKNVFDKTTTPAKILPNVEFEHYLESKFLKQSL